MTGGTTSLDFPVTPGAFQTQNPELATDESQTPMTAFVTKLNPIGSALVYSTFLGGGSSYDSKCKCEVGGDQSFGIDIDPAGNTYLAGMTYSESFPVTVGAFQARNRGYAAKGTNGFVAKLDQAGAQLVYSTYLGGSGTPGGWNLSTSDGATAIRVDRAGFAYVTGLAASDDFPTTRAAVENSNSVTGASAFLAKLADDGTGLEYSTYLGAESTTPSALAIDKSGYAYVAGSACVENFPVTWGAVVGNSEETPCPRIAAFLAKVNPTAATLAYSTLMGGTTSPSTVYRGSPTEGTLVDGGTAVAVDHAGNAYLAGYAQSTDFPTTPGAFQTSNAGHFSPSWSEYTSQPSNSFVSKLALADFKGDGASTTTTISASAPPGSAVTLTVQVTGGAGSGIPTGIVWIAPGNNNGVTGFRGASLGLDANGSATWTSSRLPGGDYRVFAVYEGDAGHLSSWAATNFTTSPSTPVSITLTASANPQLPNTPTTFTAAVTATAGGEVPNGVVWFEQWWPFNAYEPATVDATGHAYYTTSFPLPPGSSYDQTAISAAYSGTSVLEGAFTYVVETVFEPSLKATAGTKQKAIYGTAFPIPLSVQITDRYGENMPLLGIPVTFSGQGLSFSSTTVVTDANGRAQVKAIPSQHGFVTAAATLANGSTVRFNHLFGMKAWLVLDPERFPVIHYGDPVPAPSGVLTAVAGLVNGDTLATAVSGQPIEKLNATSTSPPGYYPIQLRKGTLTSPNYQLYLRPGLCIIYRAHITVTADSFTIQQGQAIPPLTYTLTGFVNGETADVVTGTPVLTTTATSSSPPGVYPITVTRGTLFATNYAFPNLVPGTITIQASSDARRRVGKGAK